MDWQPIETVPKDGTPILVVEKAHATPGIGEWPASIHLVQWVTGKDGFGDRIAHWLPIDEDMSSGPYCAFDTDELSHWQPLPPLPE